LRFFWKDKSHWFCTELQYEESLVIGFAGLWEKTPYWHVRISPKSIMFHLCFSSFFGRLKNRTGFAPNWRAKPLVALFVGHWEKLTLQQRLLCPFLGFILRVQYSIACVFMPCFRP
jgi:hypothetical protein